MARKTKSKRQQRIEEHGNAVELPPMDDGLDRTLFEKLVLMPRREAFRLAAEWGKGWG